MLLRITIIGLLAASGVSAKSVPDSLASFLNNTCYECHDEDVQKGDLDLTAVPFDFSNSHVRGIWTEVFDRVQSGDMPPKKKPRPDPTAKLSFEAHLSQALTTAEHERREREGRSTRRRMNRHEYEQTLRQLFSLPELEVKDFLPEDSVAHGFNKVGDALDVSHVQMARYLSAAEYALSQALIPQAAQPNTTQNRYYAWDAPGISGKITLGGPKVRRTFPIIDWELQREHVKAGRVPHNRKAPAAERDREAMVVLVSSYEPTELRYSNFEAPASGWYQLTFAGYSVWMAKDYNAVRKTDRHEPITIYAETLPRKVRKLGSFDFGAEPTVRGMRVWLHAGETIRPDAARLHRSRPPHHKNPHETAEGMPGVAFQWMDVEGPIIETWPPAGHRLLFDDLPLSDGKHQVVVSPRDFEADAQRLIKRFMYRVHRAPPSDEEVDRFYQLILRTRDAGYPFTEAMLAGYTAVLSSPGFLYFNEPPGELDGPSLAARLSYFLWNTEPDVELRRLAHEGRLQDPTVLRQQTERLLNDPRSRNFINAFLDYWLELRLIAGTAPDAELYPDYQLDDLLVESMVEETQLFFHQLIQEDLGAKNLVDANFAMLNGRLALHYQIPDVHGVHFRRVALTPETNPSARGGLLTQASVLKVTANGTTTSPILRGTWIMSHLLGQPPPPPPESVPAVEPDTRGATTIREQLEKHSSEESCRNCHRLIDPPGFALENYDVMGGWRTRYRSLGEGDPVKGIGHNGIYYRFKLSKPVDPSGTMPNGFSFERIHDLKAHLGADEAGLAANLARQFTVYATGAPIGFTDRMALSKMVENAAKSGYGVRTIIHEVVQSDLFRKK